MKDNNETIAKGLSQIPPESRDLAEFLGVFDAEEAEPVTVCSTVVQALKPEGEPVEPSSTEVPTPTAEPLHRRAA